MEPATPEIALLVAVLRGDDEDAMAEASLSLSRMGVAAVPALITALKESSKGRQFAAQALKLIGEPAVPALVECLKSDDEVQWCNAIWVLGEMGECAAEPLLGALSQIRNEDVLSRFVPALSRIGEPAVRHIDKALKDSRLNGDGRLYAAVALKKIGKAAIPSLEALITDADPAVSHVAKKALAEFSKPHEMPKPRTPERRRTGIRDMVSGVNSLFTHLINRAGHDTPETYDPALHYNCFVETVREADRQAVYKELRRRGVIRASHILPDGRLQLSVSPLSKAIEAYNAVAKEKVFVAGLTKARLIELQVTNPDMEVSVIEKTANPSVLHAERIALRQIVINSETAFRKGLAFIDQNDYQKAIECFDEAIRIEPDDIRAWNNKIMALAKLDKLDEALETVNEILGRHANIGLLWEAKGRILTEMGKMIDVGECMSIACQLNPVIAKRHEARIDQKVDKRFQALMDDCIKLGKDPEKDVEFWFGKFADFVNHSDAEGAAICLQMAARNGPDHSVMSADGVMVVLPPGHPLLAKELLPDDAKVERLKDFFDGMVSSSKLRQK